MRRRMIAALLIVAFISTGFAYAESKQYYSVGAKGSNSLVFIQVGDSSSEGNSSSVAASFSGGFENENYIFDGTFDIGIGGTYGSLSYTRYFKNAIFTSFEVGFGGVVNYGYSFGSAIGLSFIGVNNIIMDIGLTAEIAYQGSSTTHTAVLIGGIGLIVKDTIPINDSLSLNIGMSVGSIPLFGRLYDSTSGESQAFKYRGMSTTLRTGIKYSFTSDDSRLRLRKR